MVADLAKSNELIHSKLDTIMADNQELRNELLSKNIIDSVLESKDGKSDVGADAQLVKGDDAIILRPTFKDVLIMKTKINKTNTELRKELISKMDPRLFNDAKVTNSRSDGSIIFRSNNKEELTRLLT